MKKMKNVFLVTHFSDNNLDCYFDILQNNFELPHPLQNMRREKD